MRASEVFTDGGVNRGDEESDTRFQFGNEESSNMKASNPPDLAASKLIWIVSGPHLVKKQSFGRRSGVKAEIRKEALQIKDVEALQTRDLELFEVLPTISGGPDLLQQPLLVQVPSTPTQVPDTNCFQPHLVASVVNRSRSLHYQI
ncbi:hypothetical protein Sjap_002319 [Stephania japonica]|uniref:Uncharacterized protein n=1 Tax=Stephania japonica TaxID=461633 RepID=A0AAP0PUF5_9MAGN